MTDLYGPDAMKLGEVYWVVNGKKGLRLEKVSSDKSVILDLPEGLHKVMQVEALLLNQSVEQACLDRLKEVMASYLTSEGFTEMLQKTFEGDKKE